MRQEVPPLAVVPGSGAWLKTAETTHKKYQNAGQDPDMVQATASSRAPVLILSAESVGLSGMSTQEHKIKKGDLLLEKCCYNASLNEE